MRIRKATKSGRRRTMLVFTSKDVRGRAPDDTNRRTVEQLIAIDLVERAMLTFNGFEKRMAAGSEQAAKTNAELAHWTRVMVWVVVAQVVVAIIALVLTVSG